MRTVARWNIAFAAAVALAFVLPRFGPRGEGFAAGATATLVFLALLLVAAMIGVAAAVWTLRQGMKLSAAERLFGYAPAVIGVLGLVTLVLWLRF